MKKSFGKRSQASLIAFALAISSAVMAQSTPPNVVLILVDDLGIEHLDIYGISEPPASAATPNLTQLAAEGLVFREAWANPLCSPTRATVLTGRYAYRTGVGRNTSNALGNSLPGLPLEEMTLPELLNFHAPTAYTSALFGKWHLGVDEAAGGSFAPNLAGYDHFEGVLASVDLRPEGGLNGDLYFNYPKTTNGITVDIVDGYSTSDVVNWTIDWMQSAPEPWLAMVTPLAPHAPFHWPPEELHSQDTGEEGDLPKYRAMIEALDHELGRLLDVVDTNDTLIIFASDNGSPEQVALPPVLPNRAKGTLFQGGIKVPLVIAGTGVSTGEVKGIVNLSDLFATVAEIANAAVPANIELDSVSLVPYFAAPEQSSLRTHAVSEMFSPNGSEPYSSDTKVTRNAQYKYGRTQAGKELLVDLFTDPWETNNLLNSALTSEQQAAYDELLGVLKDLPSCPLAQVGESCWNDDDCCSGNCQIEQWWWIRSCQ